MLRCLPVAVLVAVCGLLLVGCGVHDAKPSSLPPAASVSACRGQLDTLDRQVDRAGVRDVDSVAIPGFPFLRINRLLASFSTESLAPAARQQWLQALAAREAEGRRVELAALGAPAMTLAEIEACRATLLADLAQDSNAFERLRAAARVPDDYSLPARVLGLYSVATFFARQGVATLQTREAPRPTLHLAPTARLYASPPVAATALAEATADFASAPRDALGIAQPSPATLQTLLAAHAPVWAVDTLSDADRMGRMAHDADARAVLEPAPSVYVWISQTRFEQQVLTQLNYLVWFAARAPQGAFDPLAGAFDGLVWRVTLDADGQPLLWDSVHACGCYHLWFPGPRLRQRAVADDTETPWVPFTLALTGRPGLQIDAGTHYLKGVGPAPAGPVETLTVLDYDDLRQLPDGRGGVRSLFAANGLLAASVRPERWLLWPLGVPSPGTMRQRGHQATAFIGRRHFDDARGIERYFGRNGRD